MMINSKIFKSYDIRGIYPTEIDENIAFSLAQGYVDVVKPSGPVAVGMDVRTHSEKLKESFIRGLIESGVDVVDIGLASTEMIYFTVGYFKLSGGVQITASHNTAEYNGFKMTRENAIPLSSETGLLEIRESINKNSFEKKSKKGGLIKKDILDDYADFVLKFINKKKIKPFKIAYNPNFGYQGIVLRRIKEVGNLPLELNGLNHLPDGNFPKGRPDPFRHENRPEFIDFTKNSNSDLGVAWDADADRVFFCTKKGVFVEPYFMNALLIPHILKKEKKGKIIYDPRYTWALIDAAKKAGGSAILERVGHSFIKERMRKENAVFSGESSGHTYFRDFWYADNGAIPLLMILEILSEGVELDALLEPFFKKYFISGEINFEVDKPKEIIKEIKDIYKDSNISEIDGLSVELNDWRMNVRASNTEPLLRVNIEGKNRNIVDEKQKEITNLIQSKKD